MQYIGFFLYGNIVIMGIAYMYLFQTRKLIGFQLGMNIANMAGGFFAVAAGVLLIYQFPLKFVTVTIVTTLCGMIVGALFGGLFDYQTLLTGYANGLMMGIMAPMVGAAAQNSIPFLIMIELIFVSSLFLFILSAKHT
ncbi:hypothetical protein DS031_04900 [Bacillus taeanensis]|uniref:Uncharacterized protein n=2 Tax=Bacillus taeanensis TaxID=273032 RepID=A0A366Y1K7_9BACI|nr:hypothetical protein DS031_04900 [Bacillus taeanensis]